MSIQELYIERHRIMIKLKDMSPFHPEYLNLMIALDVIKDSIIAFYERQAMASHIKGVA